jgi:hypothetical protein
MQLDYSYADDKWTLRNPERDGLFPDRADAALDRVAPQCGRFAAAAGSCRLGESSRWRIYRFTRGTPWSWLAAYAIPALEDIGRPRDLNDFLRDLEMEKGYLLGMLMPAIAEDLLRLYPLESADDFERRFGLLIDSDFDGWQSEGIEKWLIRQDLPH